MAVDTIHLKDCLTIIHINARSLLANFLDISLLAHNKDVDILCISESWLPPITPDSHVYVPGYHVYRCDKGRGGGVCMYIKDYLTTKLITCDTVRPDGVEDLWVSVQCRKLPSIIVGCAYRHPKATQESFIYFNDILKNMCLKNKPLFMLGDLNENILRCGNKLKVLINANRLHQIINKPTRVTPDSATLLDVLVTNKPDLIIHSDVLPKIVADHDLITATINITKPKRTPETRTFRHHGWYTHKNIRT